MGIGHAINLNNILISNIFILSSLTLKGGGASSPIATHSCACYSMNKQIQTFTEVLKKNTNWMGTGQFYLIINTKLNNTVNSFLYSPKVESNGVAFFLKLGFFLLTNISASFKWFEQIQLEGYMVESPNLKRSNHAQCFGILKKLTFLQEELFVHFFPMQNFVLLLLT